MYEVIRDFTDLQDNEYPYNVGDIFPRDGLEVSRERLSELSGRNNLQRKPLIKKIEQKTYTKSEIQRMSTADLQNLAAEEGIEDAYETNGSELKKILAKHFGLE